jgi:hypothetical protein
MRKYKRILEYGKNRIEIEHGHMEELSYPRHIAAWPISNIYHEMKRV